MTIIENIHDWRLLRDYSVGKIGKYYDFFFKLHSTVFNSMCYEVQVLCLNREHLIYVVIALDFITVLVLIMHEELEYKTCIFCFRNLVSFNS